MPLTFSNGQPVLVRADSFGRLYREYEKLVVPDPDRKGVLYGNCNRQACQLAPATYFNRATLMHYCEACARLINEANHELLCQPVISQGVEVVKALRDLTGAGMLECVDALAYGHGDFDKAVDMLRRFGTMHDPRRKRESLAVR